MKGEDIYLTLMSISVQLRSNHWFTTKHLHHHYGDIAGAIDDKIDEFVESYQGKFETKMVNEPLKINVYSDELSINMVSEMTEGLNNVLDALKAGAVDNSELEDIINDIRNELNTLKFHLSLN